MQDQLLFTYQVYSLQLKPLHKPGMWLLLMFLGTTLGSQLQISSDLFLNKLNMSYGINYKYNGLLHHNIHRVWIITKVVLPKLKDIKLPDINFDPECKFVNHLKNTMAAAKHVKSIRSISKSVKPIINLLKEKELYYESAFTGILKEEIPWSLHGSDTLTLVGNFRIMSLLVRCFHALQLEETYLQEESFVSFVSCYCWTCHNSS